MFFRVEFVGSDSFQTFYDAKNVNCTMMAVIGFRRWIVISSGYLFLIADDGCQHRTMQTQIC